jgi:hypothetical protein
MTETTDPEFTEPKRIRQFVGFFKNYMGLSTIVVAALPVPAAYLDLIPMFAPDRGSTSVITSLICFLLLAYIFFNRHALGRVLFPDIVESALASPPAREDEISTGSLILTPPSQSLLSRWILILILLSTAFFLLYQLVWISEGRALQSDEANLTVASFRLLLMGSYAMFFAAAESAFVLMATKEYLQELLGLSDNDLIRGRIGLRAEAVDGPAPRPKRAASRSVIPSRAIE